MFKLGEDLISDEFQALSELVKNAYDADSPSAVIRVVTTEGPEDFPTDSGYVEVIDRGTGMSIEDIKRGWLTVSNSRKREEKAAGNTTAKGRTPLGDKGLGRLGAQRLGYRLTISTNQGKGEGTHYLSFDWRDFLDKERLSEIDLTITTTMNDKKRGTTIRISDLVDSERLSNVPELERELAGIVSPYTGVSGFKLRGSVDGESLDLGRIEEQLRRAATIHYDLNYGSDDELSIKGRVRLGHLLPNPKAGRAEFERLCAVDQGAALLTYMRELARGKDLGVRKSSSKGWWLEFQRTVRLVDREPFFESPPEDEDATDDLMNGEDGDDESLSTLSLTLASPGPFSGEVDVFNLGAGAFETLQGFDSVKLLREQVGKLAGIGVYRDGFTIRVAEDWMGLGKGSTSGGSWYGLRPGNTTGYIAISAAHNDQLVETTDREGFSRTPHYENFEKLIQGFVEETNSVQEFIGRSYSDFRRENEFEDESSPPDPSDLTKELDSSLAAAAAHALSIASLRASLVADSDEAGAIVARIIDSRQPIDDETQELLSAVNALGRHAARAAETTEELERFVQTLERQRDVGARLQAELDTLDEQLEVTYETMAVGLLAEALTHEIANVADRLAKRTSQISRYLNDGSTTDKKLANYVEHVKGSVSGLRRQVAHIAPSLRYVREKRETINVSHFLEGVDEYFSARWKHDRLELEIDEVAEVTVRINRGKLLQVFDNLVLNSEYWLKTQIEGQAIMRGVVKVKVHGSYVDVSDNGLGVDPEVENSLFEPFVTRKPAGRGRGLGLFVIRRLLESEGCNVSLRPERNESGRRYIFRVELDGAVIE